MEQALTPMQIATRHHRDVDMLIQNFDYAGTKDGAFRGCSVGCLLSEIVGRDPDRILFSNQHQIVSDHFGYPVWLAYLQDDMFEGLPDPDHLDWHVQLADAIAAVGPSPNWAVILHRCHIAILDAVDYENGPQTDAAATVRLLHERAAAGDPPSANEWSEAGAVAWAALGVRTGSGVEASLPAFIDVAAYSTTWKDSPGATRGTSARAAEVLAQTQASKAMEALHPDDYLESCISVWSEEHTKALPGAYQQMRDVILSAIVA